MLEDVLFLEKLESTPGVFFPPWKGPSLTASRKKGSRASQCDCRKPQIDSHPAFIRACCPTCIDSHPVDLPLAAAKIIGGEGGEVKNKHAPKAFYNKNKQAWSCIRDKITQKCVQSMRASLERSRAERTASCRTSGQHPHPHMHENYARSNLTKYKKLMMKPAADWPPAIEVERTC